jgi:hypothetical protein
VKAEEKDESNVMLRTGLEGSHNPVQITCPGSEGNYRKL